MRVVDGFWGLGVGRVVYLCVFVGFVWFVLGFVDLLFGFVYSWLVCGIWCATCGLFAILWW